MVNHPKFFGWESFGMVRFDLWTPSSWSNEDIAFIVFLKIFLTYFLHLNNYLVTLFHNTICRAQLFCPFLLSASEYLSNMLFSYHLLYFCTALSLIIMLSSHYHHHKSKTFSQLTQCPFTGTLLLFKGSYSQIILGWILMIVQELSTLGGGLRSLRTLVYRFIIK